MINFCSRLFFVVLIGLLSTSAQAAYTPTVTIDKYLVTLKVNADATIEQTLESLNTINTQKGVEEDGQRTITFNSKLERVQLLDAYTLQPDGRKIKVPEAGIKIKDDSSSDGAPMFTEVKRYIIIYPEVKIGSKLYYKFKSFQHTPEFAGQYFDSSFFSPHYQYKNYTIDFSAHSSLPIRIETKKMTGGYLGETNNFKHYRYTFVQKEIKKPESLRVETEDFAPYFTVTTFKDYEQFSKAYADGLKEKTVVTPAIQALANKLTSGLKTDEARVRAIHNWVSKNIRYVAVYLGKGGVVPHDADTILKNLYGDCKDHAVLLETLLKAVNIDSTSALINLGEAYTLPKLPVLSPLNHVINYIPSLDVYLDSTAEYAGYGTLPPEDMDKPVLLTKLGKIGHTPTFNPKVDNVTNVKQIVIQDDGTITGKTYASAKGYLDVTYRLVKAGHMNEDDESVINSSLYRVNESGSGTLKSTAPLDLDSEFLETSTYRIDPIANFPGPGAMAIPQALGFNMIAQIAKSKPENKKELPSYCYSFSFEDVYSIQFPKQSKIVRIPTNVNFATKNLSYQAAYRVENQTVFVKRRYEENYPQATCGDAENEQAKLAHKVLQRDLRSQIFYDW